MNTSDRNITDIPFVYCNNLPGLVSHLLNSRGITEEFHLKIGIDGGGGLLKICLSILNTEQTSSYKSSGLNKLMIIGIGPNLTESYNNLKIIFDLLNLHLICGVCNFYNNIRFKVNNDDFGVTILFIEPSVSLV